MAETVNLLQNFRFAVTLTASKPSSGASGLGDGAFAECSGLQLEADVREYLEGGRNDGVIRRVGRVKLVPLVLKRGMFSATRTGPANTELWDWLTAMVAGTAVRRYNGQITLLSPDPNAVQATWSFEEGLPLKVLGPTLNAKTGEIAVEELQIAHQGLRCRGGR